MSMGLQLFELIEPEVGPFIQHLLEGGAFGHLSHPFEEIGMTFGEVKEMVNNILSGNIEAFEKIDGQQISFSWKAGRLVGARNKSQLKEFGKNALVADKMREFFVQNANVPQVIADTFYTAMIDLEKALSNVSEQILNDMFQEGRRFMNTEIVAEETSNVIPYYKDYLVFHGLIEYDVNGNPVRQIDNSGKALSDAINAIGVANQSKFQLKGPNKIVLKNFKELPKERNRFLADLKKIQGDAPDNVTIEQGQEMWWKKFILKVAKKMDYQIPENVLNMLAARWGKLEKAVNTIPRIKSQINNDQFKTWMIDYDRNNHEQQYRENMLPYELFFLRLGAEVLSNASGFLTASPVETVANLAKGVQRDALRIKDSKNVSDLKRLQVELERLEKIGKNKIVGSEGVVFSQNDKLYKLTGVFQPVHRILSILKYRKPEESEITKEGESALNLLNSPDNPIDRPLHTTEKKPTNESVIREGGNAVYANSALENKNLIPTIKNALKLWGLGSLRYETVGSTHKSLMNDIDVAISADDLGKIVGADANDRSQFWPKVESFFKSHKPKDIPDPAYKVNKGLDQVHISSPIIGQPEKFVQIDLMLGDVGFMKDALSGAKDSKYKAIYRNLLFANILRFSHEPTNEPNVTRKYQFNWKKGLQAVDLSTVGGKIEKGNIRTIYNNMDDVAEFLFGSGVKFSDINTFEKLFKLLESPSFRYRSKRDEIIDGFNDDLIKMKLPPIEKE